MNILKEAQLLIDKQKRDRLIQRAKCLLEDRETYEKRIKEIDAKLAKIENGEDVDVYSHLGQPQAAFYPQPYVNPLGGVTAASASGLTTTLTEF